MDFPLEVIPEAEMSTADDSAIRSLLRTCFPDDAEAFSQGRAWQDVSPAFTIISRMADSVVGHIGMVVRTIRCGEIPVVVSGVQSLCVGPSQRKTGLSQALMAAALAETTRRDIRFGLLFCIPALERFYGSMGWAKTDGRVGMLDIQGRTVPIPDKNIGMQIELGDDRFPPGPIHLNGRDW